MPESVSDGPVATHIACRLALIAFATVALRGVLEGSEFRSSLRLALQVAAGVFGVGIVIGELARRLIEDMVLATVRKIIDENTLRDGNQELSTEV